MQSGRHQEDHRRAKCYHTPRRYIISQNWYEREPIFPPHTERLLRLIDDSILHRIYSDVREAGSVWQGIRRQRWYLSWNWTISRDSRVALETTVCCCGCGFSCLWMYSYVGYLWRTWRDSWINQTWINSACRSRVDAASDSAFWMGNADWRTVRIGCSGREM